MFKKVTEKEIVEFNKVFSLMLISKLPVIQALELIYLQTRNKHFKMIIKDILKELKSGHSLSKSFSKYKDLFSEIYIANLKVAEETGQIAEVLSEYTQYIESIQNLKRKIMQAVRYPALVLIVTFGVVFFMVFYLIPMFESLFFSAKMTLPALTQLIISVSYLVKDNSYFFAGLLLLVVFIFVKSGKSSAVKSRSDRYILAVPYVSALYKKNILARFALSMGIQLKSGVALVDALKISANISENSIFKVEIDRITRKLIKGESFSSNISSSKFFDLTFSKLLTVGEESAELEKVFYLISNYYSKEFDYQLDSATSLIEPVLILIVGMIVAVILVAMYLPMFEIINQFGV